MWIQRKFLKTNSSGFTLLEVLIALAIMAVTFGAILMVQSGSINSQSKAKQMTIVSMLAKTAMVDAEVAFEGKKFEEMPEEESGDFDAPYEHYKWKREIKEVKFPNVSGGVVQSGDKDESDSNSSTQEEQFGKMISEYLTKALREVTITITWEKGSGSQNFSITTYWVNLDHEFNI